MSLLALPFDVPFTPLPALSEALVADGEARLEDFLDAARRGSPSSSKGAFVPADYRRVYAGLAAIEAAGLAPSHHFCEWGSGLGVVTALAAQLGFAASGIEIERDLVEQAEALADQHGLDVEFAHGSFIPEAAEAEGLADVQDDLATLGHGVADGYDELGASPEDFGLIYAYPWPGEEQVIETLFNVVAARGALLLTYRSTEDLVLQRKV